MANRRTGEHAVSEPLDRLRKAMRKEQELAVQAELRKGATIVQAMAATGTVKRFVEEQRAYLKQTEGLADTRCTGTSAEVARLTKDGFPADQIAQALGVSVSSVYQHRRKHKKV